MTAQRILKLLVVSTLCTAFLMACSDSDSSNPYGAPDGFDPTDLPEGTATESWGISDLWYDYTFDGHTVSPRDISWVITTADDQAYFAYVKRYYGDTGHSAMPAMEIQTWDADTESFQDPVEWKAEERITETQVCLTLADAQSVPCDGDYDILWRTDKRPVPEVQMAPSNPGLYVERRKGLRVYQYHGRTPPEALPIDEETISSKQCATEQSFLTEDGQSPEHQDDEDDTPSECDTLPWRVESAFDHDAIPLVTLQELTQEKSVFQLTANLYASQWRADIDADNNTLNIDARCVYAEFENACSDPLDMDAKSLTIDLDSAEQWTFISLCELPDVVLKTIYGMDSTADEPVDPLCENNDDDAPCITASQNDLRAGAWPDNRTFDLVVQNTDDDVRVWIAPSQPIVVEDQTLDENTTAPRDLWSLPGPEVCE